MKTTMIHKLSALAAALVLGLAAGSAMAQAMRPEVGKPLQAASDLLKAGKGKEALAKVREAEAVGGKTAAEALMVDRMKAAAAQRAGDNATAAQALESLYGKVSGGDRRMAFPLMRAACAVGLDGIFAEIHPNPPEAKSDATNQLYLKDFENLVASALKIDRLVKLDVE